LRHWIRPAGGPGTSHRGGPYQHDLQHYRTHTGGELQVFLLVSFALSLS